MKGRQVGLMLLGEPESGEIPTKQSLKFLDKLGGQLEFYLSRTMERNIDEVQRSRTALLLELSRLETVNLLSASFIEKMIHKISRTAEADICFLADIASPFGVLSQKDSRGRSRTLRLDERESREILAEISKKEKAAARSSVKSLFNPALSKMQLNAGDTAVYAKKLIYKSHDYGFILFFRRKILHLAGI